MKASSAPRPRALRARHGDHAARRRVRRGGRRPEGDGRRPPRTVPRAYLTAPPHPVGDHHRPRHRSIQHAWRAAATGTSPSSTPTPAASSPARRRSARRARRGLRQAGPEAAVQACRFRGSASSADLSFGFVKLAENVQHRQGADRRRQHDAQGQDAPAVARPGPDRARRQELRRGRAARHADEHKLAPPGSPTRSRSPISRRRAKADRARTGSSPPDPQTELPSGRTSTATSRTTTPR